MDSYQYLIINIFHQNEPHLYTVRLAGSGEILTGFDTIQQVDFWLKTNGGDFTSGPKDTEGGWTREARIAAWTVAQARRLQEGGRR